MIIRFQVGHLQKVIRRDAPKVEFIKRTGGGLEGTSRRRSIRIITRSRSCCICLRACPVPRCGSPFTINPRAIFPCKARRPRRRSAYQFAEKVKKHPGLQAFTFNLGTPRILPNDHAQFRLEGKTK